MTQTPSAGRIVRYTLSEADVDMIVAERMRDNGARGNEVSEGDTYPAIIVRTFDIHGVNLQVLLDGNHTHWATSRVEGNGPGQWAWPKF